MKKNCLRCRQLLPSDSFRKNRIRIDGLHQECRECEKQYKRQYYQKNKKKIAKYAKQYYQENKKRQFYQKQYQLNDEELSEHRKQYQRKCRLKNKEKINELWRKRYKEDPKFRLNHLVSSTIRGSLKTRNMSKSRRCWESLVDFTLQELMIHLEGLFQGGMTWENQGKWHLDHIRPISNFNFESVDDAEFKKCWSLDNLQPLWAEDNFKKGKKYEEISL